MESLEAKYIINTYGRKFGQTPALVRGVGSYVWDDQGKIYLDLLAGLAVNIVGHCHPEVTAAIKKQAEMLMHTSNLYYSKPQGELAALLVESAMPGGKVFFANSGAEANEAAIKLARKRNSERYKVITAHNSFHGRTLATLAATGQPKHHKGFEPLPEGFACAEFNDLDSFASLADGQTAAVLIEPVQGEGGVHVAEESFIKGLRELCDEANLLLIFDEIQCGMGRTGKLWAFENYGVTPDLLTVAKGLGGGLPVGAMVAAEPYAEILQPGEHASTFGGNQVVCSAAQAVFKILQEENFLEQVRHKGYMIRTAMEEIVKKYPQLVKEFRGMGLICALELDQPVAKEILARCTAEGVLINAIGENILRFLPPLIIADKELKEGFKVIDQVLKEFS
ncbi:MAG: aspartate aminotransferase family protein [Bacillota bacterium]